MRWERTGSAQVAHGEMKYQVIMSDVWRAVITVGQWQGALTRKLTEGALVFLHNRLI